MTSKRPRRLWVSLKRRLASLSASDLLATAALWVSVVSLAASGWTACEQRRQWRATALARMETVKVGFVHWRILSEDAARSTTWGYPALLAMEMKDRLVTGNYLLMNRVVARLRVSRKLVPNVVGVTVPEIAAELGRRRIDAANVELQQQFQIEFDTENIGQSLASAFQAEISGLDPERQTWTSIGTTRPVDVGPGRSVQNLAYLHMTLGATLPERVKVRIRLAWTTEDGDRIETNQPMYYHSESAAWKFGD